MHNSKNGRQDPSPIQQWAKDEAQVPGSYIHPETQKNMGDALPPPMPNKIDKAKKKDWGLIAAASVCAAAFLLLGFLVYQLRVEQDVPLINSKDIQLRVIPGPDKEKHWSETQDAALEQVLAWERLAERALRDYYRALERGLPHPGLCITTGNKKSCYGREEQVPLEQH